MERRPRRPATALVLIMALAGGCGTQPPADTADWSAPTAAPPSVSATTPPVAPSPRVTPTPTSTPRPSATSRPPANYVFPVNASNASFGKTHSGYPASDIFADCGKPVVAVTDGVILEVTRVDRYDPADPDPALRGGLSVSLLGDDGVRYYGSHLSEVAAGIAAGKRVRGGQRVGEVGKTGRANNVCHLHFGISPPCARTGDWWIRRGAVWPAKFLGAWRSGRSLSPAATVASWRRANGCPAKP